MHGLSTITSCFVGFQSRQAVTSHVCTWSASLIGGQVWVHTPENPLGRTHPFPMMWLLEKWRQRHYPFKFSSLCPHPSSRPVKPGQLQQTQSLLRGWQNLVHFPYFTFGGKSCLFYPGKVKVAICLVSPTSKALHPLNFCTQILLFSTSIIIKL